MTIKDVKITTRTVGSCFGTVARLTACGKTVRGETCPLGFTAAAIRSAVAVARKGGLITEAQEAAIEREYAL